MVFWGVITVLAGLLIRVLFVVSRLKDRQWRYFNIMKKRLCDRVGKLIFELDEIKKDIARLECFEVSEDDYPCYIDAKEAVNALNDAVYHYCLSRGKKGLSVRRLVHRIAYTADLIQKAKAEQLPRPHSTDGSGFSNVGT